MERERWRKGGRKGESETKRDRGRERVVREIQLKS